MKPKQTVTRRRFLNLGNKFLALIPLVHLTGCISDHSSILSPADSLKKLIFILGPWTSEDKLIAEEFAERFLKANHIINQYLPKTAKIIQSLSLGFPDNSWAVEDINLKKIPKEEHELLIVLGKQLYSFVEMRFYVSNEPSWGECQGNSMWQTRIPK